MILYEDNDIIVCHKPAGVPVQSASVRTKDMVSILRSHLREDGGKTSLGQNGSCRNAGTNSVGKKPARTKPVREEERDVYVVHRLDQPVEGVMVFAKTKRAAADLSRQAAGDGMKKRYHAVVEMTESAPDALYHKDCRQSRRIPYDTKHQKTMQDSTWHTLVDYLVKDGRNNRSFVAEAGQKDAKRAELRYRILKACEPRRQAAGECSQALTRQPGEMQTSERLALAEIELMTGRHHQIRVQMAHAGMPLYGDRKYNQKGAAPPENNAPSLALCAVSLTFRHPRTKKEMTFSVTPKSESFPF